MQFEVLTLLGLLEATLKRSPLLAASPPLASGQHFLYLPHSVSFSGSPFPPSASEYLSSRTGPWALTLYQIYLPRSWPISSGL